MFNPDTIANEVIDRVLAHYHQIGRQLYHHYYTDNIDAPLSDSPLRDDILLMVQIANGEIDRATATGDLVNDIVERVQRVVNVLLVPAGGNTSYPMPATFWTQPGIGQVLTLVHAWLQRDDVMSQMVERSMPQPLVDTNRTSIHIPTLYGKTLPIEFAEGLIGAIIDIFGYSGGTPELLYMSIQDLLPADMQEHSWRKHAALLNPLYTYYDHKFGVSEPIDYVFLERTRQAMDRMYPQGSKYLSLQLGYSWWVNDYPVVKRRYSSYSLQYLLGSDIALALRQAALNQVHSPISDDTTSRYMREERQRVRLACQVFAHGIHYKGGITCTYKEGDRHILLAFPDCPFCCNSRTDCSILMGVVQRMILWLYGDRHVSGFRGIANSFKEVTHGLFDLRPVQNNSHTVAIIFE